MSGSEEQGKKEEEGEEQDGLPFPPTPFSRQLVILFQGALTPEIFAALRSLECNESELCHQLTNDRLMHAQERLTAAQGSKSALHYCQAERWPHGGPEQKLD